MSQPMMSPDSLANTARLLRQVHAGAMCLVEGGDDKEFYRRFIDTQQCKLLVAFGWQNAIGAIAILEKSAFPGVLAIIDADFGHLDAEGPNSENVLWTDVHDLEMIL